MQGKDSEQQEVEDDTYASGNFLEGAPKSTFPTSEHNPRDAYALVHDELLLDGNSRQNLATFCQTWEEPEVHKLMDECLNKNMVDKDEYPQTAEIEARCVRMLSDLWKSTAGGNAVGTSTGGSPSSTCWAV